MSSLGLTQEELKTVEQTRQRLSQLSSSLNSLKNDAFVNQPLPNLGSLQASADILNRNVQAILELLAQNHDLFSRVAVHPSTNFPGRTQENILLQLLRKKPEPDVEATMHDGREVLAKLPVPTASLYITNETPEEAKERALEEIWSTTRQACQERIAHYVMNEESDVFTTEERAMGVENVRTGLRRNLDESDDEEDEEEEEEEESQGAGPDVMVIDRPPPPPAPDVTTHDVEGALPETVIRIATIGHLSR